MELFGNHALFHHILEYGARRSLPSKEALRSLLNCAELLRQAVQNLTIVAYDINDIRGLKDAYQKGFLQCELLDEGGKALYYFPSRLHHR